MGINGSTNGIKPLKGNSSSRATVSFFLLPQAVHTPKRNEASKLI